MAKKNARRRFSSPAPQAGVALPADQLGAFDSAYHSGDYPRALRLAEAMVQRYPKIAQAHELHAKALGRLERYADACDAMVRVMERVATPGTDQQLKLAQYQVLAGRAKTAVAALEGILEVESAHLAALVWLSRAYHQLGNNPKALEINGRALALDAHNEEMLHWRARILDQHKRHDEALKTLEQLLAINPKRIGANNHIAALYVKEGGYKKAETHFSEELKLDPSNGQIHSNLLVAAHYNPEYSAENLFTMLVEWEKRFAKPSSGRADTLKNPAKKLRIGLLSGGFRMHPVGQMILPALKHLPCQQFEVIAYSTSQIVDKLTQQIQEVIHRWEMIEGLSAGQLNQKFRNDSIDILIDMNGAGEGSRYDTLTQEPAPLIVKWVGSLINTTGLSCFDYLLSDSIETPEGVDDLYVEKLIRLPDDYICYHVPEHAPSCNALPALSNGYITFGCLNNPAKLSPPMLAEWAKLLKEVPDSKLLLRGIQFESSRYRDKIADIFAEHGVAADRLVLEGPAQHQEFMATYQRIDIALDTWPYSGGLTTCEALMMGVPVVTRVGPTFAGRHSATHLANAGLPELVTDSWEDFRIRAKELASDLPNLAVIRAALRTILTDSPICDGPRFASHLTTALRAIWQRHCEGKAPEALTFSKSGAAQFADEYAPVKLAVALPSGGFDWQLESPVLAVDNGAILAARADARELLGSGRVVMLSFDPAGKLTSVDHLAQYGEIQHFAHTSLGSGQPATLHVGVGLEPTTLELISQDAKIETHEIPTVALDSIEGLPAIDLLALDACHDDISILWHAEQALKNTLLIQVRVVFQTIAQNQPDFARVNDWMEKHGFRFYRFFNEHYRGYFPDSVLKEKRQATDLQSADALFIPTSERYAELGSRQRIKLSFVLHTLYDIYDLAYSLLKETDPERAARYLEVEGLIEEFDTSFESSNEVPPPAGPPIPQDDHIKGKPILSVICTTYNHADYIEDAIKGIISQKTDFPFEIIIHDDASTDGTQDIIEVYASKYPDMIVPIYQKENQYSQNRKPLDICLPLSKGQYVAICEGDDYWTDAGKLQKQFEYMENHKECVVTHHNAFVFEGGGLIAESKLPQKFSRGFSSNELLKNDCFVLTLSMMFRKKFNNFPSEKGNVENGDNFLISMLGLYGESHYLENIKPAAYRLHSGSTWSSKTMKEKSKMLANSFWWIAAYHERKKRLDLADFYYKKSASALKRG
ncbi:glycosyltransferase [Billgrantia bachuensis]|uniref:protein O-GlcNAc transferase n=1 Tax=Billgrantia bachuensis TaxID=2717286 RepID=A0ABX0PQ74_9GAMM|nr:glycosyltransferase [Halomonas bachuensis]NIC04302.1 glycosyltransferase [Halomonas bachuensis]